jgi:hypothetical protein
MHVLVSQGRSREEQEERVVVVIVSEYGIRKKDRGVEKDSNTDKGSITVVSTESGRAKDSKTVPPASLMSCSVKMAFSHVIHIHSVNNRPNSWRANPPYCTAECMSSIE